MKIRQWKRKTTPTKIRTIREIHTKQKKINPQIKTYEKYNLNFLNKETGKYIGEKERER